MFEEVFGQSMSASVLLVADCTLFGVGVQPIADCLFPIAFLRINFMPHMVKCVKYGREMEGLDEPPFDNELGQKIYENVSKQAWKDWGEHQKMLMNEYRLQPWKREAQEFLAQQLQAYFFGEGSQLPQEYVPPAR